MSGPADDALARLAADHTGLAPADKLRDFATVRDELQRLRDERDAALDRESGTSDAFQDANASASGYRADRDEWRDRAEAAEAALAGLGWDMGLDNGLCWCNERRWDRDPETGHYDYSPDQPDDHSDECKAARRVLAATGGGTVPACSCGHPAERHPAIWSIAGDATTHCQVEGCPCRDYDEAAGGGTGQEQQTAKGELTVDADGNVISSTVHGQERR